MKEKRDQNLEHIFRKCADGGARPSERVTAEARAALRARSAETVPAAAGAGGSAVSAGSAKRAERRTIIILAAAACLLSLLVGLFLWRLQDGTLPGALLLADGTTYVSDEGLRQSTHEDTGAESPACLPWVESNEIVCCREYTLAPRNGTDEPAAQAAETVLYRVEYRADGVSATVYIETENVYLLSLGDYKRLPEERCCGGVDFRLQTEKTQTYVYFETEKYKYNLQLETAQEEQVTAALTAIGQSL